MKKSTLAIPLLLLATLSTIVFGQRYSAKQREGLNESQVTASEANLSEERSASSEEKTEEISSAELLSSYEKNKETLALFDYLDYVSLKNSQVSVAYYGDIALEEPWVSDINRAFEHAASGEVTVSDHTYPDSDTYDLYIQQTAQAVLEDAPDVIIYGLPALPDKIRDMGLAETEEFMGYILNTLLSLDGSKVYLLEPYPVPNEMNQVNSRSLDYRSYLTRMQGISEDYDVTVIPLHSNFLENSSENDLSDFFDPNGQLTEKGSGHVFSTLTNLFSVSDR